MEGVRVEYVVPFTSNLHSVAFVNVKFHLPGEFPLYIFFSSGFSRHLGVAAMVVDRLFPVSLVSCIALSQSYSLHVVKNVIQIKLNNNK